MNLTKGRLRPFLISLAAGASIAIGGNPVRAQMTIDDIVENVRRNEALYADVDATLTIEYSTKDRPAAKFADGSDETTSQQISARYVVQGDRFRLDRSGVSRGGASIVSLDRIRAFDGKTTRVYDQNAVGNIIRGREEDADWLRPHMLFMRDVCQVPLSTYLSGHDAMMAHPRGNWNREWTIERSLAGTKEIRGQRCYIVRADLVKPQFGAVNRWEFWLAEDRNFLPLRAIAYGYGYSKKVPIGEGNITETREIEPGIWFPMAAVDTAYNPAMLQIEGRQVFMWENRFTTESVSLQPSFPDSYFEDVRFPVGTAVSLWRRRRALPRGKGPPQRPIRP